MNEIAHFPPPPPAPPAPPAPRTEREGLGPVALLLAICLSGVVAVLVAAPRLAAAPGSSVHVVQAELTPAPPPDYSPAAQAITPITSLTATAPSELGGSTTGSLYASADRIDIYARSAATSTLHLVEWQPDDGKWVKHGADCSVTTDLTLCRYVAKRGARYWHVYRSAGTVAYTGIEQAYNQGASLGTIEPTSGSGGVTSVAMSVPSILSVAGSPITTTGTLAVTLATQTANTVFAGPTSGGAAAPTFRALVAADVSGLLAYRKEIPVCWSGGFGITGSQTDQVGIPPYTAGTGFANDYPYVAMRAGSVTGISISLNRGGIPVSGGSLTAKLFKNGSVVVGAEAAITADYDARATFSAGTYTYSAADRLEIRWTTTVAYAGPAGGHFSIELTE